MEYAETPKRAQILEENKKFVTKLANELRFGIGFDIQSKGKRFRSKGGMYINRTLRSMNHRLKSN